MNRVLLRNLQTTDKEAVFDILQNQEVMCFLGPRRALTNEEALDWFSAELKHPSRFAVALKDNGELIGFCGVKRIDGVLDFGYFFRHAFWGNGYATEACELVIPLLAREMDLQKLEVFIAKENKASLAVASKLGWKRLPETTKNNR